MRGLAVLLVMVLASACSHHGYRAVNTDDLACGERWQEYHERVNRADAFDARDWPLPDYPFLRVDRSASFLAKTDLTNDQRREWLRQAYERGRKARRIESARLSPPLQRQPMENCLRGQLDSLVQDEGFWEHVRQHPRPDAYSDFMRVIGLYPLFHPIVSWQVRQLHEEMEAAFQNYQADSAWQRYEPDEEESWSSVRRILDGNPRRDSLGLPDFSAAELETLFAYYSPVIEVETGHPEDRIGRPHRRNGRWTTLNEPQLFTHQGHTLWRGEWLPQLIYQWWYPGRPRTSALDLYGGELDGLIFRVTLDWDGRVLFYDTVHPCGCYHKWYPAQPGIAFSGLPAWDEPLNILPVEPPEPPYRVAIRVNSGQHYVVDMTFEPEGTLSRADRTYRRFSLDELRRQPMGEGYLFNSDGLVHGTERLERFFLWNLGVASAGAMRQWGHHATAFVGRRHFDDPLLFEKYFKWRGKPEASTDPAH